MLTATDEHDYQDAPTDYYYKAVDPRNPGKNWLAWTALMPITDHQIYCLMTPIHSQKNNYLLRDKVGCY
jgi:hypothetical protein